MAQSFGLTLIAPSHVISQFMRNKGLLPCTSFSIFEALHLAFLKMSLVLDFKVFGAMAICPSSTSLSLRSGDRVFTILHVDAVVFRTVPF